MTVLAVLVVVGLVLAFLAGRWRAAGRDDLALGALALALGVVAPWPYGLVVVLVGAALALQLRRSRLAVEAERTRVVDLLKTISSSTPLATSALPDVQDEIARRALVTLASRQAEHAARATRRETRPPAGVRARFMAAMGHELRSPLNSISGFAQLLEDGSDGPLNEAQHENVVLVRRAAQDLLTLLTDILDTARIETGRIRLEREWIAPVEVLTLALERLRASDVEVPPIDVQLQPGLSPLYVDRTRLGQSLFNVLRAVARGGSPLHARVRELREGERSVVRFELHDRGKSITEADAQRAFDPDPAARPEGRSLALGLALSVARDLAQLHKGGAKAEPLGGGTSWIVWVPAEAEGAPPRRPRATPMRERRPSRPDQRRE